MSKFHPYQNNFKPAHTPIVYDCPSSFYSSRCDTCQLMMIDYFVLLDHIRTIHRRSSFIPAQCYYCQTPFENIPTLIKHINSFHQLSTLSMSHHSFCYYDTRPLLSFGYLKLVSYNN
jgi:hypothetical protein